jgi:hypothetical protein
VDEHRPEADRHGLIGRGTGRPWVPIILAALVLAGVLGLVARELWRASREPDQQAVATAAPPATPPTPLAVPSVTPGAPAAPTHTPQELYLPGIEGGEGAALPPGYPAPSKTPKPTKTPRPSPTPTLPWPPPLAEPGRSKLGIHVQWNNSPEIMEFIRRMKPAVVKAVGDKGFLAEVKAVSPETIVIARHGDEQLAIAGDPIAAARDYVAAHLEEYLRHPAVDYWEGYNEPVVQGHMPWFAAFEAERVRAMAEHGLRTAIGAFSTGVPEWGEFATFLPAVREAYAHGGILTLHEYDAPIMDRSVGSALPGRPPATDRGCLALRYRWWYEEMLKPEGIALPLVISEAGVDGAVSNRPGPDGKGWLDFQDYWRENGLGPDVIQAYVRQLSWYDAELQRDDYVLGFAVFTAGAMNDDWETYDITGILRHLATYIVAPQGRAAQ